MSYKDRRRTLWVLFLIGLALIAVVAQAPTLVRLHFQDLVHYSYSIARVRCMHADARVENGEIWTDTSFRVLAHNKGYLPEEIVVRQPGGKFQHLHSHVEGAPDFRPAADVYLFLTAQRSAFNEIVPDVREPGSVSGGSACPVPSHHLTSAAAIAFRWSTMLGTNPKTILTQNQTVTGTLNEIEQVIQQSLGVWSSVSGTALTASSIAPLVRGSANNLCGSDGINSICFDQPDMPFTPLVLAFTRPT